MALKTNRVLSFIWHSPQVEWPLAILGERPCIRTASVTCLKAASVSKIHRLLLSTLAGNFECWLSDGAKLIFHAFGDETSLARAQAGTIRAASKCGLPRQCPQPCRRTAAGYAVRRSNSAAPASPKPCRSTQ